MTAKVSSVFLNGRFPVVGHRFKGFPIVGLLAMVSFIVSLSIRRLGELDPSAVTVLSIGAGTLICLSSYTWVPLYPSLP